MTTSARTTVVHPIVMAVYLGAIVAANVVVVTSGPAAGAVCDAAVILALLNSFVLGPPEIDASVLVPLALVPLLRLVSLATPSYGISQIARGAITGCLLLLAVGATTRVIRLDRGPLFLRRRRDFLPQALIALGGIPLGFLGERILMPRPLAQPHDLAAMVVASVALGVVVAPTVELVFRWALQGELITAYGRGTLIPLNFILFASMYANTRSVGYVVLMGVTGLLLSLAVERTGSVWGAIGAHSLLDIGVFVAWPALLR